MIQLPSVERVKIIDISQRRVPQGEDMYRFIWVLYYHDGRVIPQYRMTAGNCIQTRFALILHSGIREVQIHDILNPSCEPVIVYPVPHNADVDILYTRSMSVTPGLPQGIVFSFGWQSREDDERWYIHVDPNKSPIRVWQDTKRSVSSLPVTKDNGLILGEAQK